MKESRFYKYSLLLPVAVPALVWLLVTSLSSFNLQLPTWLIVPVVYTTFSGLIGGVPYLMLIGLLFLWARGKSDTQFKRAVALLPVLMLTVVIVLIVVALSAEAWFQPENAVGFWDALLMLLGLVPFILGFGYFYMLVVFSAAAILRRRGMLLSSGAI